MEARRPKVVHLVVAGHIGGAEHFLVNLVSRPASTVADHCVALMTPNPKLREYFCDAGLTIRDRGAVRENPLAYVWRSFGPADLNWLAHVLIEEQADIVHAHTFGSQILAVRASRRLGIPVMRTEHGVGVHRDPSRAFLRRWALEQSDRIVAVSEFVGQTVAKTAPVAKSKIRVIANGIDTIYFSPAPAPMSGPFTFSMVTRIERVKRVDLAVEAIALTPQARLEIAGDGAERPRIEALIRSLGISDRVRLHGYCSDPRPVVSASDAGVNCTFEEGLPLAVIEAAAMQRATVGFAGGGMPEIIEDGRTGWLVREHTAAAFANAFRAAADRTVSAACGLNARNRAEANFGIEGMCRQYGAVYAELVERSGRAA